MGRFLSVDPVPGKPVAPQLWNLYSYVTNNPMIFADPSGMYLVVENAQNRDEAQHPADEALMKKWIFSPLTLVSAILLGALPGWAGSISHHLNMAMSQIQHSNGIIDGFRRDSHAMARATPLPAENSSNAVLWEIGIFRFFVETYLPL